MHVTTAPGSIVALLRSERLVIAAGLVTGPLYGLLGDRWRIERWWASAVLMAGPACLEPLAQLSTGRQAPSAVWIAEAAAGLALAGFFLFTGLAHHRATVQDG